MTDVHALHIADSALFVEVHCVLCVAGIWRYFVVNSALPSSTQCRQIPSLMIDIELDVFRHCTDDIVCNIHYASVLEQTMNKSAMEFRKVLCTHSPQ
jgi:hypothetical protein